MAEVKRRYHAPVRTEQAAQPGIPLIDREPFRHAYAAGADLHQRAAAFAAGTSQVYQRAGRLFLVLAQTAGLDPELAALWDRARSARLQDCQRLLDLTGCRSRPLRDQLTDLLFVQSGPGVHADLVGDRHWSNDAYQSWLTTAVENLLACQHNASPSGPATRDGSRGPGGDHDRARS